MNHRPTGGAATIEALIDGATERMEPGEVFAAVPFLATLTANDYGKARARLLEILDDALDGHALDAAVREVQLLAWIAAIRDCITGRATPGRATPCPICVK